MDVVERTRQFIEKIKVSGLNRVAVFCHGGILASALILTGKTTPEHAMDNVPTYGTVLRVEIPPLVWLSKQNQEKNLKKT